jgi:hypothetical protein
MKSRLIATTIAAGIAGAAGLTFAQAQQTPEYQAPAHPQKEQGKQGPQMEQRAQPEARQGEKAETGQTQTMKPEMRPGEKAQTGEAPQPQMRQGETAQTGQTQTMKPEMGPGEKAQTGEAPQPQMRQGEKAQSGQMNPEMGLGEKAQTGPAAQPQVPQGGAQVTVSGNVRISQQTASRISETLMSAAVRQNINIASVSIGSPIPGNVELLALPPAIVSLVPEFRGYEYVAVQDEIVIIEPSTRSVVEIIRPGGMAMRETTGAAKIVLTEAQRRLLIDSVRQERLPEAQVTDLAEGVAVAPDVELESLPQVVVTQIPMIERYRVFLANNNRVALVDPDTRKVVDVVE